MSATTHTQMNQKIVVIEKPGINIVFYSLSLPPPLSLSYLDSIGQTNSYQCEIGGRRCFYIQNQKREEGILDFGGADRVLLMSVCLGRVERERGGVRVLFLCVSVSLSLSLSLSRSGSAGNIGFQRAEPAAAVSTCSARCVGAH